MTEVNSGSIVIKCGTRVLVDSQQQPRSVRILELLAEIADFIAKGLKPVVVTSGAVAIGLANFGLNRLSSSAAERRAAAAVGQARLISILQDAADKTGVKIAQLLLNRSDFENRKRFVFLSEALQELLNAGIVPVLNENDATAVQASGFRDNDHVAALSAILIEAKYLFFLSSAEGLYTYEKGERKNLITQLDDINSETFALVQREADTLSVGGMRSKLLSAQLARQSGAEIFILSGEKPGQIQQALSGTTAGTRILRPEVLPTAQLSRRKAWIAFLHENSANITIDQGACKAITSGQKSLLAVGIKGVNGEFGSDTVVSIMNEAGVLVAKGLSRLSSSELTRVIGMKSDLARSTLNNHNISEVINRDDLVVFPE
jgi:glutamate 5-kinase